MALLRSLFAASLAGTLFASPAHADIAARYQTADDDAIVEMEMTIEADEHGNVRTQMARLGAYYLLRDGQLYQVAPTDADPVVARVADIMTLQAEFAQEVFDKMPDPSGISVPTFAPMAEEVVQGRTGMAYGMVSDTSPEPQFASIVISQDASLAPLGVAIADSNEAMSGSVLGWGQMGAMLGQMNAEMLEVVRKGAPLRLLGMELTDVSTDEIPAERFELPAEPLTLEQLRARTLPNVDAPPTLPPYEG